MLREILSSRLVGKEAARWRALQVAPVAPSRLVGAHQPRASLVVIYNLKFCQQEMYPQHHLHGVWFVFNVFCCVIRIVLLKLKDLLGVQQLRMRQN